MNLQHEVYRLEAVVSAQDKALEHWRRSFDIVYAELEQIRHTIWVHESYAKPKLTPAKRKAAAKKAARARWDKAKGTK